MNPLLSWAIMLFVSGGFFWYYRIRSRPGARTLPSKPVVERHENGFLTKKGKRKAKRSPDNTSSSGTPTPLAKPIVEVPEKQKVVSSAGHGTVDEGMDNREFAKQLSKAKEGTKLSSAESQANNEVRTKKIVSSAVEPGNKDATESSTRTSSTTGADADADDDLSSVNSPVVNPTLLVAGDVSDMLAPAPAGIPTLRLVGNLNEQPTKKKQKPENIGETKKQRQRRLKNESRKIMVEEAEKERRIQLEKQLHVAREYERREVAKSKPPVTNAWKTATDSNQPNGLPKSTSAPSASLLDTFDPAHRPGAKPPATSENIKPSSSFLENWASNLPSEEEQMRIIMSENEWTTVSNRKKERKNGSKRAESVSVSESSSSDFQAVKEPGPSIKSPPQTATAKTKTTTAAAFPPKQVETFNGKGHPLDSDWDP
ncbi:hypothetical protein EMCG_01865 [[Emmonsia] crescens]|uniref:Uncharacterized protein n=1 Tax=[Emmonsia] crescens TaxID=73230 RepID=A0A0G2J9E3_9EURO|nr:hypothetical protein EMCG_01865 [Emmonsia crescens UAMH 3008]